MISVGEHGTLNTMTDTNTIRDRAYQILTDRGLRPLDVPQHVWKAACEQARTEFDAPSSSTTPIWCNR